MGQQHIISSAARALQNDQRVSALFLSGSFGRRTADRFSDIDLVAVAARDMHEAIATEYRSNLSQALPIVFWRQRAGENTLLNAITEEWQRIDTLLIAPERLSVYARDAIVPLFDRANCQEKLLSVSSTPQPNRARVESAINEFIRVLGLLAVVIGREEYETGVAGAYLLRAQFTDLLVEASASRDKGGALHMSRELSREQRQVLANLPSPTPTRDGVIEAHLATARAFLPFARAVLAQMGLPWPSAFEEATWRYLKRELAIDLLAGVGPSTTGRLDEPGL
jgi:predicted nucleotidyltransferase